VDTAKSSRAALSDVRFTFHMEVHMPDLASRPLPPYRGILAVDTERFTGNPSARQPDLGAAVHEVLQSALERCGHPQLWEQRRFPQGTGDGCLFGVFPEKLPFLLSPFLDALDAALADKDDSLRAVNRGTRLRLRVSVNVGPVPDSGDELRDRIGEPTNTTCRLLDSTPVRNALRQSNPDVTLMAAIVSQRVFDDVIRAGYTPALHPDQLEQVTAEVPGKDFAEPAWLYVPRPSRRGPGGHDDADGTSAEPPWRPTPSGGSRAYTHSGSGGQQINADQVHGGITYGGGNP
jgi:class 3 adenylate cyclase